jgi:hypothetical protein
MQHKAGNSLFRIHFPFLNPNQSRTEQKDKDPTFLNRAGEVDDRPPTMLSDR